MRTIPGNIPYTLMGQLVSSFTIAEQSASTSSLPPCLIVHRQRLSPSVPAHIAGIALMEYLLRRSSPSISTVGWQRRSNTHATGLHAKCESFQLAHLEALPVSHLRLGTPKILSTARCKTDAMVSQTNETLRLWACHVDYLNHQVSQCPV
jgi:hypothetical protein